MNTSPAVPATALSPLPLRERAAATVYEMRTLSTDAERDEAVALVQDRQRWLTMRGLRVSARADNAAMFRSPQAQPAGLFEDGLLLACLIPQRAPALGWGQGACLFLSCVHTLPDRSDDTIQLITLWASDFAARLDLSLVRAEALARQPFDVDPIAPFLRRLTDMGWVVRIGHGTARGARRSPRTHRRATLWTGRAHQLSGPRASVRR